MDHVQLLANQRNDARKRFGETSVHLPGRTDLNYPNLSGTELGRLIFYWRSETDNLRGKIVFGPFTTGIPDSAHKEKWLRDKAIFERVANDVITRASIGRNIAQGDAVLFWQALDNVVLPMAGLAATPTRFDLGVEAGVEAATEFGERFESSSWLMPALVVVGGLIVYNMVIAPSMRR